MKSLKIGFAGSPAFAEKILSALLQEKSDFFSINMIITQAPKRKGRGLNLIKTPVSILGEKNSIPVFSPESFLKKNCELKKKLNALDLLIVVAYGLVLPCNILKLPNFGCINIHPSLLPRWRGASPIHRAIEAGDESTGVCLIQMEENLDTGPIWKQESVSINENDTYASLETTLLNISIKLVKNFLFEKPLITGCVAKKQSENGVLMASKILKFECKINWSDKIKVIHNKIRAFDPYPGVYTSFGSLRIKLANPVYIEVGANSAPPGTSQGLIKIDTGEEALKIICGNGILGVKNFKKEGGKWISARDFFNSNSLKENIYFN